MFEDAIGQSCRPLKAAETETPHAIVEKIEDTESLRTIMQ